MRKKKSSSHEKTTQKKAQQPMNTYYDWIWYRPAHLHEHPIQAKILKSEKKLRKVKKKIRALPQNKTGKYTTISIGTHRNSN
jgi:hypothetical protein